MKLFNAAALYGTQKDDAKRRTVPAFVLLAVLASSLTAASPPPVALGSTSSFAVLAGTTVTVTGAGTIGGNIGIFPGTAYVAGTPPVTVSGTIYAGGPVAAQAQADLTTAYNDAAGRTLGPITVAGNIGGQTLAPGLYKSTSSLAISSGDLTLDAQGDGNAVWIFQIGSTLTTTSGRKVILAGGANPGNIFWQVGSSATIGTTSVFQGNILAAISISMLTGSTLSGRALASGGAVSIDTGGGSSATIPPTVTPPSPPTVISTLPVNGATGVSTGSNLAATFSRAMDPTTITATTYLLKQGLTAIAGTVTYSGVTAIFQPTVSLAPGTLYTATITTGAKDTGGIALASNYVWTFTTGTGPDLTPPVVISTVPVNNAVNVSLATALTATFSKALDPTTVTVATFSLKQGITPVTGTVSYSGIAAVFKPTINLTANTLYTATLSTGLKDLAGNALATAYTWTFTTGAIIIDVTPPTVISTIPASGATSVPLTTNLVVNFSKPMDPLTITGSSFSFRQGITPVAGTVTYSGTTATLRPAVNLAPNTRYDAVITSGATDLAGNALAGGYGWNFTTGSSVGQSVVCLPNFAVLAGSAIISSGATSVTGDLGVSPGTSVSGFPPGNLAGTIHLNDAAAVQGIADFAAAYSDAVSRASGTVVVSGNIGGQTFTAGLYRSLSSLDITSGDVILDAKGDINAVFIFQAASTLTLGAGNRIILVGGTKAYNVFWQVGTSANLGASSVFKGSILADQSITMNAGATLEGRLTARSGTVTLQSSVITSPPPAIFAGGVINAATVTRTVAAGSIASVFGNNLASSLNSATSYPLPLLLGGSGLQAGTQGAPLFLASCGQLNVQIPWEVAGQTQVAVTVTAGGLVSTQEPALIAPFAPGIFSLNQLGTGQGAVEIAPTAVLAARAGAGARPVKRGEYVAIFATGLGAVSNQPATGAAALSIPLSNTSALPTVIIGGAQAQVTYSGLAPGFAGLYQVNAVVPDAAVSGDSVGLSVTIGGVVSNTVTIAVQ